jgi:hypothetical protein
MQRDPTEEVEVGCLGLTKLLLTLLVLGLLAGKFFTGDYMWNYKTNISRFMPVRSFVQYLFQCS